MPILSTSSLTDMPLVRLRELIMSSRWVRPISEIKRWFIRLKWLEWNESAGLYTPRSLLRKRKIYTTVERKRNYKRSFLWRPGAKSSYRNGEMLLLGIQRSLGMAPTLRVEILVVVLPLRRELHVLVPGFGVLEDFPFVIPDHDFFVVVIENVTGIDRHFAAAAGSIDNELGHGVTCGVAAQPLDDLDAFSNRRAQVRRAIDQIALINVVGADPAHQQLVHESFHGLNVIIDAS